jgi:large subunit ribosomal protein L7/L12
MSAKKDEAKKKESTKAKKEEDSEAKGKAEEKIEKEEIKKAEKVKSEKAEKEGKDKAKETEEKKKEAKPKKEEKEEKKGEKAEKEAEEKEEKKEKKITSKTVEKIIEMVESMTVLELSELVKALEEHFGVTAAAPMAVAPGVMGVAGAGEEEAEEQTEFDAVLKEVGQQKIQVIKVVRKITGLGLIEAKKLVEDSPAPIKEAVTKEEAEEIKKKVEEVGATVEIK